jgi:hypothetical protein
MSLKVAFFAMEHERARILKPTVYKCMHIITDILNVIRRYFMGVGSLHGN